MNRRRIISQALLTILVTTGAEAAQRSFVSAEKGSDANLCTRQQPCRNFAAAVVQTDPGGEIVALDSGGYGVVSITQSVSAEVQAILSRAMSEIHEVWPEM
jgi:hypothetical protein